MRKKIPLVLSEKGIDDAIKEVKAYKKWLKKCAEELAQKLCDIGEDYAIKTVGHIDTGETVNSIHAVRNKNKGVIVAGGAAIWLEFGTGVYYNGNPNGSPHPKGSEIGYNIGEYGKQQGLNEDGWWYIDPKDGARKHTMGIEANMFLYKTAQELKKRAPELAKEVFKFDD